MTTAVQEEKQIERIRSIKKLCLTGLAISTGVVCLGLVTSYLINRFYPFVDTVIGLLQAFSVVPGAALFGVREIHSWSVHSPAELFKQKLSKCFLFVGLFFPVVAFSLHSSATNESPSELEERIFQKVKAKILQEITVLSPGKNGKNGEYGQDGGNGGNSAWGRGGNGGNGGDVD